jgi:hypothetical protein
MLNVLISIVAFIIEEYHDPPFFNGTERFKNVNNCLKTNFYSCLDSSVGESYNLYLNTDHFSTAVLIGHLWQLKTVVFLNWCLICSFLLGVNQLIHKNAKF